jgi:hypothetical protein
VVVGPEHAGVLPLAEAIAKVTVALHMMFYSGLGVGGVAPLDTNDQVFPGSIPFNSTTCWSRSARRRQPSRIAAAPTCDGRVARAANREALGVVGEEPHDFIDVLAA